VAARRLIIVLVVMLMLSTFAAVLVPVREDSESTTESSTTTTETAAADSDRSRILSETIDASAKKPQTVKIALGDTLTLRVRTDEATEVAIPRLDEIEDADPADPALFDLLPIEAGEYRVTELESGDVIGTVEVQEPKAKRPSESGRKA
jgi:hypothetical protein